MRMPMGGMMGGPQGMQLPPRGGFGGGMGQPDKWMGGGYQPSHPGMRGPQPMPPMDIPGQQPMPYPGMGGGGWAGGGPGGWAGGGPEWAGGGPEWAGPIGAFPNMPPQFQGGPPAGGWGGHREGSSNYHSAGMGGGRGMPGGFGGRPEAGPPVPRRLPGRDNY